MAVFIRRKQEANIEQGHMTGREISDILSEYEDIDKRIEEYRTIRKLLQLSVFLLTLSLPFSLFFVLLVADILLQNRIPSSPILIVAVIFSTLAIISGVGVFSFYNMRKEVEVDKREILLNQLANMNDSYGDAEEMILRLERYLKTVAGGKIQKKLPTFSGSDTHSIQQIWALEWYLSQVKKAEDQGEALDKTLPEFIEWNIYCIEFSDRIYEIGKDIKTKSDRKTRYLEKIRSVPSHVNTAFLSTIAIMIVVIGIGVLIADFISGTIAVIVVTAILGAPSAYGYLSR